MSLRFSDVQFDPIRVRFAGRHLRPDLSTAATVAQLGRFAMAKKIDPDRLTMVTSTTICEFLGWPINRWRWLVNEASSSPLGPPPRPREPGGPRRGRGVSDLWLLELDIIPWLLSTDAGRLVLVGVIEETRQAVFPAAARARRNVA